MPISPISALDDGPDDTALVVGLSEPILGGLLRDLEVLLSEEAPALPTRANLLPSSSGKSSSSISATSCFWRSSILRTNRICSTFSSSIPSNSCPLLVTEGRAIMEKIPGGGIINCSGDSVAGGVTW